MTDRSLRGNQPLNGHADGLAPAPGFLSHAKNRVQPKKQYEALQRVAESLRTIGVQLTRGNIQGAHATLDDAARAFYGQTRVADIHLKDAGAVDKTTQQLAKLDIYTVKDLANSRPVELMRHVDLLDVAHVAVMALRRIVDLEAEREAMG